MIQFFNENPSIIVALIGVIPLLIGGASGWIGAGFKAKANIKAAQLAAGPAMQAAISASVDHIIQNYRKSLEDSRSEVQEFRAEVRKHTIEIRGLHVKLTELKEDLRDANTYIDKLSVIMKNANLEVPERPKFSRIKF